MQQDNQIFIKRIKNEAEKAAALKEEDKEEDEDASSTINKDMEELFDRVIKLADDVFPQQVKDKDKEAGDDDIPVPSKKTAVCLTAHNNLIYYDDLDDHENPTICCYGLYAAKLVD